MPTKDFLLLPDVIKKVISLARLMIRLIGKISFLAVTSVWTLYFHRNYHPKAFSDFPFPANELLDTNKEQPTRHWAEVLDELEAALDEGDVDLFRRPNFQFAFHLSTFDLNKYYKKQIIFLRQHRGGELLRFLREDHAWRPRIVDLRLQSSEALTYHLSHIAAFEEASLENFSAFKTVVEFGGGYGGTTRLINRMQNNDGTIVVIDFFQMLRLNYYYQCELGLRDRLHVLVKDGDPLKRGMINFVPIGFTESLGRVRDLVPDIFVATWSLSEASQGTQKMIRDMAFFESKRILYGYYAVANSIVPHTESMTFPGYVSIYNEQAFYSSDSMEKYNFLRLP